MPATVHGVAALIVRSLWERGRMAWRSQALGEAPRRQYCTVLGHRLAGPNHFRAEQSLQEYRKQRSRTPSESWAGRSSPPVAGVCRYSSGFRPTARGKARPLRRSTQGERARPHAKRLRDLSSLVFKTPRLLRLTNLREISA